jgi:hypothetical protein
MLASTTILLSLTLIFPLKTLYKLVVFLTGGLIKTVHAFVTTVHAAVQAIIHGSGREVFSLDFRLFKVLC